MYLAAADSNLKAADINLKVAEQLIVLTTADNI
jgi:hypothetical protein